MTNKQYPLGWQKALQFPLIKPFSVVVPSIHVGGNIPGRAVGVQFRPKNRITRRA